MSKKVLVTGGRGFIGSHLCNFLKDHGNWVRSVDIKEPCYLKTQEDEFLQLDLRDPMNAVRACEDIDLVFTLAADMGGLGWIMGDMDGRIMRNNALININMLEAVRKTEKNKRPRIFFSSSACVYPRFLQTTPEVKGLKEDDVIPAHPDSSYGWEKLFSEILYKSYEKQYGVQVRIARFHNIMGPFCSYNDGREKAPAAICRKVAETEDDGVIEIWGDGKQTRSFTYITDCLRAVYLLMQSDYSDPINIGTSDLISIDDLAKSVMSIAGKKLRIKHNLERPQGVRGRNANITLIKRILGWSPEVSLFDGMTELYEWIKTEMEKQK